MIKQAASDKVGGRANTARDGNIAISEEFDAAVARNTVDAFKLFIDRHPAHRLAEEAGQKMRLLLQP